MNWQEKYNSLKSEMESLLKEQELLKEENAILLKNRELYYAVLEASPEPFIIYDLEGKVTYLNPAFTKMFGWTLDELLQKKLDFVPEENMPETIEAVKQLIRDGKAELPETRRYTKDRRILDIKGNSYSFNDEQGNAAGSVVILRNITEKKKMQEAISASENKFHNVMEATPDAIVIYNHEGKVSYLNPSFTKTFGWTMEELVDKRIDFIPKENLPETTDAIKRMNQGEKVELTTKRYTKDKEILDIHLTCSTFLSSNNKDIAGSIVILRDITTKVEEELQKKEERFQSIAETIPAPVIVSSHPGGDIKYINKSAGSFFRISREEFTRLNISEIFDKKVLRILKDQGRIKDYEIDGFANDGFKYYAALNMQPIQFREKDSFLSILFDLTERKKALEEITRLQDELKSKLKEKEGKYLTFLVGSEKFGISLDRIKKIMELAEITPIPNAPSFFKGFITIGKRFIPVIDLKTKLNIDTDDTDGRTCVIVVELGTNQEESIPVDIGMTVNSVSDILDLKGKEIDDPPEFGSKINIDYVYGIAKKEKDMGILINVDKLFSEDEIKLIDKNNDHDHHL